MNDLQRKAAEVQLGVLKLQHKLLESQFKGDTPGHPFRGNQYSGGGGGLMAPDRDSGSGVAQGGSSGGRVGSVNLDEFANKHGGRMVNGMLAITPPKLLSAGQGSTGVGPSSMRVETIDGKGTVSRVMGRFYFESGGMSGKLDPNEELMILRILPKK